MYKMGGNKFTDVELSVDEINQLQDNNKNKNAFPNGTPIYILKSR